MSLNVRLNLYTILLLKNSPDTSKCNWNKFLSKKIFYMIPKRVIVIFGNDMVMIYHNGIEIIDRSCCESHDDIFELCFQRRELKYCINFELNPKSWIFVMVTFLCFEYALNRIVVGCHRPVNRHVIFMVFRLRSLFCERT